MRVSVYVRDEMCALLARVWGSPHVRSIIEQQMRFLFAHTHTLTPVGRMCALLRAVSNVMTLCARWLLGAAVSSPTHI